MGSRCRRCRPSYTVYSNCGELSCQRSGRTCGQFAGCAGDDAQRADVERSPPAHYQCMTAVTNRLPDCRGGLKVECDKALVPLAVTEQAIARRRRRILAGPSRQRSRFDLVRAAPSTRPRRVRCADQSKTPSPPRREGWGEGKGRRTDRNVCATAGSWTRESSAEPVPRRSSAG
jgi:hypothetical protein